VALGLAHRVHFRTVGLSKAVASRGGVVIGSARNMEFFRYEAYPMIFSTSVLGHEVAGFEAALDIIETEEWRRTRLHHNHAVLRAGLDDLGYNVDDCDTQILSLEAGLETDVRRLRDALEENDVFGSVFCAPATPKKRALVRFTVNASLTAEQINHVLSAGARIRTEVGMAGWASTRRRKGYQSVAAAAE
jgi:CAI-1 autoinducer synthase